MSCSECFNIELVICMILLFSVLSFWMGEEIGEEQKRIDKAEIEILNEVNDELERENAELKKKLAGNT